MKATRKILPKNFTELKNIFKFVLFAAVFGLAFVNLYNPFGWLDHYDIYSLNYIIFSGIVVLTGVIGLTASRLIMHFYVKKHQFSYLHYFLWLLCEIIVLAVLYTIISLFTKYTEFPAINDIINIFKSAIGNVSLIISLPYIISTLYFALQDKSNRLKQIESEREKKGTVHPLDNSIIVFRDSNGVFRISITNENILYLESADNYVSIKYLNKGAISDFLLRNTLHNLSKQLEGTGMIRCHRSYLVNFTHVKVIRRDKGGVFLELDVENVKDIPVSKTYRKEVTEFFEKTGVNSRDIDSKSED